MALSFDNNFLSLLPSSRWDYKIFFLALLCFGFSASGYTKDVEDQSALGSINVLKSIEGKIGSIVFDYNHSYVTTSSAVLKTERNLQATSVLTPLDLGDCAPADTNTDLREPLPLHAERSVLYLLNPSVSQYEGQPQEHALCKSTDRGQSFQPIDAGLEECIEGYCGYLPATQVYSDHGTVYANAGAGNNVLVSQDNGVNWNPIIGELASINCSHASFEIIDEYRILVGGECPLDSAYIRAYQLSEDRVSLATSEEIPIKLPTELGNRNIQFIKHMPGTNYVFAGVEGGLLRSNDSGLSFKFVVEHPISSKNKNAKYPYIAKIVFSSHYPGKIFVGGFDKKSGKPYLAFSKNYGKTWKDITSKLPVMNNIGLGAVEVLVEAPDDRILLGVTTDDASYIANILQ